MLTAPLLALAWVSSSPPAFPSRPPVVSRAEWGARPVGENARPHRIFRITIHHGGVASNPARSLEDKLRGLQAWSQREATLAGGRTKPAWPDVPYHFYISIDGRIGEARPVGYAGDTNTEYDTTGHLLIVLEGNFEEERPAEAQIASLRALTLWAAWKWRVPAGRIRGHKDFAQTLCPGKNLMPELANLRSLAARAAWERFERPR
jgi:hypothetical protein